MRIGRHLAQNWFLAALLLALLSGWWLCNQFEGVDFGWIAKSVVAVVMFLMAWSLRTSLVIDTLRRPLAALLASGINMVAVPLLALLGSLTLQSELAVGFIVMGAVPCTLASASVWTRRAGGNDAVAMMTTVITNASCFLVTPMWILLLSGEQLDNDSFQGLVLQLLVIVVLPMGLAQLTRISSGVAKWATRNKTQLGVLSQFGILIIVFISSATMGLKMQEQGASLYLPEVFWVVVLALVLHLGVLFSGIGMGGWLRLKREDRIAIGFSGSQKTLMVGLAICLELGVSILPMVIYHAIQLIADTPIADRLRQRP